MPSIKNNLLIINGGSSSVKFAVYNDKEPLTLMLDGEIEGIGTKRTQLTFRKTSEQKCSVNLEIIGQERVNSFLLDWLEKEVKFDSIKAIGHRIVQGQKHTGPAEITDELLNEFADIGIYDPEHMQSEINLIKIFKQKYPEIPQIACFDTSFHSSMPLVAKMLPLPRRYNLTGITRYGFHGLSYAYLMETLDKEAGSKAADGRIILAHLGSGASLAAVKDGKSIDTSMGFTPTSGLVMGTRTGDIDPGVALYLMQSEHLTPQGFSDIINHESGLLGVSETSSDMRDLLKIENTDHRAAEAVELFCYQAKKWIGSFAAALGGLDTLIFTGGIGQHSADIRLRICKGLEFVGISIEEEKNKKNEAIISAGAGKVTVRVMHTNEQLMIANLVTRFMDSPAK